MQNEPDVPYELRVINEFAVKLLTEGITPNRVAGSLLGNFAMISTRYFGRALTIEFLEKALGTQRALAAMPDKSSH